MFPKSLAKLSTEAERLTLDLFHFYPCLCFSLSFTIISTFGGTIFMVTISSQFPTWILSPCGMYSLPASFTVYIVPSCHYLTVSCFIYTPIVFTWLWAIPRKRSSLTHIYIHRAWCIVGVWKSLLNEWA